MRFKFFILLISAALVTTACSHGNTSLKENSQQTISEKIKKGKTKKEDILKFLGEPYQKTKKDSGEVWTYWHTQSSGKEFIPFYTIVTGKFDAKTKVIEITFDKNGIVKSYEISDIKS